VQKKVCQKYRNWHGVVREKRGVDSRDKVKLIKRNNQLFTPRLM